MCKDPEAWAWLEFTGEDKLRKEMGGGQICRTLWASMKDWDLSWVSWGEWSEVTQLCPTLWTPWTVAYQDPQSLGFPRQEYGSGLTFRSPGDLPDPGIEPRSPALQADALPSELPGRHRWVIGPDFILMDHSGCCVYWVWGKDGSRWTS